MHWKPERTTFIADIGANHDGELARAVKLIRLCASVGVDVVKFQHFRAPQIVSRAGFEGMKVGHQSTWPQSVYDTYAAAAIPWEWTARLADECARFGMEFMSTPYDLEAVAHLDPYVSAWKIGSGDITYSELIAACVATGKPVILSTGASDLDDVRRAAALVPSDRLALLQCNSNYTGKWDNLRHANVRVLQTYREIWPDAVLGLSDHSPNYTAVLPAIVYGARIIEKHFTDDPLRDGPDHRFAMDPHIWHDVVERVRECEAAIGDGVKRVEDNEQETVIVQRRCIRAARDLKRGTPLRHDDLAMLRPAPAGSIPPYMEWALVPNDASVKLLEDVAEGEPLTWEMVERWSQEGLPGSAQPVSPH